jgi:hypothetical protein
MVVERAWRAAALGRWRRAIETVKRHYSSVSQD